MEKSVETMIPLILEELRFVRQDIVGLKDDVAGLKKDVAGLKQDVAVLKQDVAGLKQDVAILKQDVAGLKHDMSGLKETVGNLQEEVRTLKTDFYAFRDDIRDQVKAVYKQQVHLAAEIKDIKARLGVIENYTVDHLGRIMQLEQSMRGFRLETNEMRIELHDFRIEVRDRIYIKIDEHDKRIFALEKRP